MRFTWIALSCLGLLACGGNSFSAGPSGDGGAGSDAPPGSDAGDSGAREAGGDASDAGFSLRCGPGNLCEGDTPICCYASNTNMFSCAHQECGCATQLACRQRSDCGASEVCCASMTMSSACGATAAGHTVSACSASTDCKPPTSRVLCDPAGANPCPAGLTCKVDAASLAPVGLVPGYGFGVCGL